MSLLYESIVLPERKSTKEELEKYVRISFV